MHYMRVFCLVAGFFSPLLVNAAPASYPLTVSVDREPTRSEMYLRFDLQRYDGTLPSWLAKKHTGVDGAFAKMITGLKTKNTALVAPILRRDGNSSGTVESTIGSYFSAFNGYTGARYIGRVSMGPQTLFLIDLPRKGQSNWLIGFVFDGQPGAYKGSLATSASPVSMAIMNAVDNNRAQTVSGQSKGQYRVSVVPGVTLELNAQILNYDPVQEKTESTDPRLRIHSAAVRSLADGKIKEYADYFTNVSAKKVAKYWGRLDSTQLKQLVEHIHRGHRVVCLVKAGAVAFVVYVEGGRAESSKGVMRWATLVRKKLGWRLTNFYRQSDIDRLFTQYLTSARRPFLEVLRASDVAGGKR